MLYETNLFLKKVSTRSRCLLQRMSAMERFHCNSTLVARRMALERGGRRKYLTLNKPGGGIRPQAGSSLCCADTVSSRKLKLSDFSYILIGLNSGCKPVPWDIHCCHGNAIVEGCSVKFWLKSVENCIFCSNRFLISV